MPSIRGITQKPSINVLKIVWQKDMKNISNLRVGLCDIERWASFLLGILSLGVLFLAWRVLSKKISRHEVRFPPSLCCPSEGATFWRIIPLPYRAWRVRKVEGLCFQALWGFRFKKETLNIWSLFHYISENIEFMLAYYKKNFKIHPDDPIKSKNFFFQVYVSYSRFIIRIGCASRWNLSILVVKE